MLDSENRRLTRSFWRRGCALAIAAVSWVVPASAQDPVNPNEDAAAAETDKTSDPPGIESDLEEPDREQREADLEEALLLDPLQPASGLEEIPITGSEATRQKYPAALTTSGEQQALRITDIAELANYTPNLEINTAFAASNPTIFIRGIGLKDYNGNAAGAVAVYQDGININAPAIQRGQFFDLEGIDVLRGPQGSVNGRNATAGAILIRSALPDGEFGVESHFSYGNYNDREIEAAINIPLIEDVLSMRVSGTARLRNGYTKNQCAGWDPGALGFRVVDEASNRKLYNDLLPTGKFDSNGELGTVKVKLERSNRTQDAFVFLNYQLALGPDANGDPGARTYASGLTAGVPQNPWVLAEDLFEADGVTLQQAVDINGNVVDAVAGTKVAKMSNKLAINDVDRICIVAPPGHIATLFGQENNKNGPDAAKWLEGNWQRSREQPGLEDFADLKRWTNNVDHWAARLVLLFEPLDNLEWMFNAHGSQNRGDSFHAQMLGANAKFEILGFDERLVGGFSENAAVDVALNHGIGDLGEGVRHVRGITPNPSPLYAKGEGGGNPYSGFYSSDGIEFIDAWGINGRGRWDLGAAVITLLYDYEWYDRVIEDERDANPLKLFPAIWSDSAWQTAEELRIEGDGERYQWTAGFFFLHEQLDRANEFLQQFSLNREFEQTLTSWAPYLSGEVDLVEQDLIPGIYELTLAAGVRYNQEKKKFTLASAAAGTASGAPLVVELPEESAEMAWKEWTGDVQLSYTPFSNEYGALLSYVRYGRGFKSGHFNAGLTITGGSEIRQKIEPVEPEFNDAVEFGLRTRWFDDRLILNAALFRYWYQDLQVFDIVNDVGALPTQKLLNNDARIRGAEAELQVKPLPGLLMAANFGWLDTEFKKFVVTKTIAVLRGQPTAVDFDYKGNRLVAAPEWNFAGIAEYEVPLFGWGSLVPRWDVNYRSKAYFDPQMIDPISQHGYWLHNARIAYRTPDDRIELAFWVQNLLDEEYKVDVFDLTRENRTILEAWGEPRTYGVTLSLHW